MRTKEIIQILEIAVYITGIPTSAVYLISHDVIYTLIAMALTANLTIKVYKIKKKTEEIMKKVEKALDLFT